MAMKMRSLVKGEGAAGLEIVPVVFGGNVFGWTADEARSFELLDAKTPYALPGFGGCLFGVGDHPSDVAGFYLG